MTRRDKAENQYCSLILLSTLVGDTFDIPSKSNIILVTELPRASIHGKCRLKC